MHQQNNMKKITLSIGIPAHNEEKNIISLITGILKQNKNKFLLKEILVFCDGCTDKTYELVNKFSKTNRLVKVYNDNKNLGKGQRLNQIYRMARGNIIVTMDADIKLLNKNVLNEIVRELLNKNVDFTAGKCIPTNVENYFQRIQEVYVKFWRGITYKINNGNNVHTHLGPICAFKKSVVKKIVIPKHITAEDHFIYFKAISLGYKYFFAKNALVGYVLPRTINEYLIQYSRYLGSTESIYKRFGTMANKEYVVSKKLKVIEYIKSLMKSPIYMGSAIVLQVIERLYLKTKISEKHLGSWTVAKSTKII